MQFNKDLIAGKLRRWEKYLEEYKLPAWENIPNFGLYMEQVIALLTEYLDYLPPELKDEEFITAATINNYVRKKIVPEPVKKKYYRTHLAYLIIVCTLRRSLSIPTMQSLIPRNLSEDELHKYYDIYAERHYAAAHFFLDAVRDAAGGILDHENATFFTTDSTEILIVESALAGGFAMLLSEKLLLLDGKTLENGGSIRLRGEK